MIRVSRALVRVTPVPNRREVNFSPVPRSLDRAMVIGPEVVLTVDDLDQVAALGEQGVDLGADGLNGR
uniref:hypothetical protein n=1 Tax=Acrocarpospora macrocephala TaxID=150177 RepID=UPI0012D3560A|nr:hypothetical protein [Acrocarpospora macrocephala]